MIQVSKRSKESMLSVKSRIFLLQVRLVVYICSFITDLAESRRFKPYRVKMVITWANGLHRTPFKA